MNINIKPKPQSGRIRINSEGTIIMLTNNEKEGVVLTSTELPYLEGEILTHIDLSKWAIFYGIIELSN
jgi:hypothetical protein